MGLKINEYALERLVFGDDDYYDIDYFDGNTYQTAKIKGSVIKAGISSGISSTNIYNSNGQLDDQRTIDGNSKELSINNLIKFLVESTSNNKDNVIFSVNASPENPFNAFIIKDNATGDEMFAVKRGEVWINGLYKLPNNTGNAGEYLRTDGNGVSAWEPLPSGTSIYDADGTIIPNINNSRIVNLDGNDILWAKIRHEHHLHTDKWNEGNFYKFLISVFDSANSPKGGRLFAVADEKEENNYQDYFAVYSSGVKIMDQYFLPSNSPQVGQIIQADSLNSSTWVDPPTSSGGGKYSYAGTFINVGQTGASASILGGDTADFGTAKSSVGDHIGFIMAPVDLRLYSIGFQWASKDVISSAAGTNKIISFVVSVMDKNLNPMDPNNWSTYYTAQTQLQTDLPNAQWPGFLELVSTDLSVNAGQLIAITLISNKQFSNASEEANITLTFDPK